MVAANRSVLSSIVLAAAMGCWLSQPAAADANLNCSAYAGAAVAENQQNISQKCGFTGGGWSNDFNAHASWCLLPATKMADLVAQDKARQQALTQCANKAVEAEKSCQTYAQAAVGAVAAANGMGCGFSGGGWTGDYAAHFNWCLTAPQSARDQETAARKNQLNGCITAKVTAAQQAKQLACSSYAATAVGQQKENLSRQCGFTGGRWSADYKAHFDWCMGVGPNSTSPETAARVALLTTKCTYTVCSTHTEVSLGIPPFKIVKTCSVKLKPAH